MKIKYILELAVSLWLAAAAQAGDLVSGPRLFEYLPSDGVIRTQGWTNKTGQIVYITKLDVYVYGANYNPGGLVFGAVSRNSDYGLMAYWSWVVNDDTFPNGPQGSEVREDFRPDYFAIVPGDGITMQAYSRGFGGPAYQSFVSGYFWYTLNVP
jgi:hypothetical protein